MQNPVKAGDGDFFENNQPLQAVNCFLKSSTSDAGAAILLRLQRQFNIAFNNVNAKYDFRLTLIATLTIHQLCKCIWIMYVYKYVCLYKYL